MNDARDQLLEAIVRAVEDLDITSTDAWPDLDALSTHTHLDDIEVEPDGIVISDNAFSGIANVYVTLQYGSDSDDGFSTSDSYIAEFHGTIEDGQPTVDTITVDTSSFYSDGDEA